MKNFIDLEIPKLKDSTLRKIKDDGVVTPGPYEPIKNCLKGIVDYWGKYKNSNMSDATTEEDDTCQK